MKLTAGVLVAALTAFAQVSGAQGQRVYPRGPHLPMGFYSLGAGKASLALDSAFAAGFNLAGPYYGEPSPRTDSVQGAAVRLGFQLVRQLYLPYVNFLEGRGPHTVLNDSVRARISSDVRTQVETVLADPLQDRSVAWWTVSPEELRYWRSDEMDYLTLVTETIRQTERAHGRTPRPIGMYEPNGRNAGSFQRTAAHTDLILAGAYVQLARQPHAWIRWAVTQASEASVRLSNHPAPIAVLQMSQDPPSSVQWNRDTITTWIRHDVVASLVAGARGVLVWSSARRPGFEHTYDMFAAAYLDAARLLTAGDRVGDLFATGERVATCGVDVTSGPANVTVNTPQPVAIPSVGVVCLRSGTSTWVVAVNSAEQPVEARLTGLPAASTITQVWPRAGASVTAAPTLSARFSPYGVSAWVLRSADRGARGAPRARHAPRR